MKKIKFSDLKEYFEEIGELLPEISEYINKYGRLPENVSLEELDFDI